MGCITRPRGGLRSFFARSVKVLQPILISPTEPLRQPGGPAANALVHRISEPTVRYDDERWAPAQGGLALPRSVLAACAPGWARHMSCRRRFGVLQTAYRSSRVERAAAGRRRPPMPPRPCPTRCPAMSVSYPWRSPVVVCSSAPPRDACSGLFADDRPALQRSARTLCASAAAGPSPLLTPSTAGSDPHRTCSRILPTTCRSSGKPSPLPRL